MTNPRRSSRRRPRRAAATPRVSLVALAAVSLGAVSTPGLRARPKPTPLAKLVYPPKRFPPVKPTPHFLPVDVSRLSALGDFHMVRRDDPLLPEPRCKTVAPRGMYRLGQGLLLYRVMAGNRIYPVGTGVVRELHELYHGKQRAVIGFRSKFVKLVADTGFHGDRHEIRAEWSPGFSPERARYFTYPSNLIGIQEWTYHHLVDQKVWVGMTREQARLVMGEPEEIQTRPTAFGWREVWRYPRTFADRSYLVFGNDQLQSWRDSWEERLGTDQRWDWQRRDTRNPWVGRENYF